MILIQKLFCGDEDGVISHLVYPGFLRARE